ncbi:hypothetical protein P8452_41965 [Trifolium repens]|nr:hypothetical protein P8452_41965 [Trifolium repens]
MISHSISNILQWMNTLKPIAIRLTGIDINQLENILEEINGKIPKRSHSNSAWLQKVKDVVIDLNDLMEDLRYKESTADGLNVKNRVKAAVQVKKAVDELKRLLEEEVERERWIVRLTNETRSYSMLIEYSMFGREKEMYEIIYQLRNMNNFDVGPVVIVIVGIPAMGKTKLARHICEDDQVKAHFVRPIWTNGFDIEYIANRATESHHNKRVLVVIDDLQIKIENDDLDKLQQKLIEAVGGHTDVAILITTRSNQVANNIAATHVLQLQGLNQEESWSLFLHVLQSRIASTNIEQSIIEPESKREIVRDCGGFPLLIVILASTMMYPGDYDRIQEALTMLKIYYYEALPAYQKLCFAYCSLFPEDYLIDAERLIQLWTAEGFLPSTISSNSDTITAEQQFGRACFNDFCPWVFHQVENKPGHHQYCSVVRNNTENDLYRMNKLMHKLAKYVSAGDENITVDSMGERAHAGMLRISFNFALDLSWEIPDSVFERAKKLRTILLPYNTNNPRLPHEVKMTSSSCDKIMNTFNYSLRVLDLHDLGITTVPSSIEEVKYLSKKCVTGGLRSLTDLNNLRGHLEISHLEQVKFSSSKVAAKDEFVKNKQHLEFMTLRWDHEEEDGKGEDDNKLLEYLEPHPKLIVLFIVGYNGLKLSNWLSSLQFLVKFTLNNCPKCQYLPPMDKLEHLEVLQLWRLNSLEFIAKNNQVGSSTPKFFPSLKELTISDCPNLKSWWENEIPENDRPSFSSISKLNIQYCPQLACMPLYPGLDEELVLVESNVILSRIKATCQAENSYSHSQPLSKLKSMVIERFEYSLPEEWLKHFTSLEELHIRDCSNFKTLPQGFESLSSLQTLSIERCEELVLDVDMSGTEWEKPTQWEGLKNLSSLTLRDIPKLKYLPWGVENVKSLKALRIYDCHGLTSLPESIGNLTSLEKLVISQCRKLDSLPKGIAYLGKLHTLSITDCPLLLPRCQPDTGDDWPQIAHIKNKLVKKTPQEGL